MLTSDGCREMVRGIGLTDERGGVVKGTLPLGLRVLRVDLEQVMVLVFLLHRFLMSLFPLGDRVPVVEWDEVHVSPLSLSNKVGVETDRGSKVQHGTKSRRVISFPTVL